MLYTESKLKHNVYKMFLPKNCDPQISCLLDNCVLRLFLVILEPIDRIKQLFYNKPCFYFSNKNVV